MDRFGNKTGGRKKGTANKINSTAREILNAMGCNPIEGMARIAMDTKQDMNLRGRMFSELAQYGYPKLRSVELVGAGGGPLEVNVSGLELLKSRIDRVVERRRAG